MVRCGSKNKHQKDMFDIDWTMCSEYANHSRLNSQHNWGGPVRPFDGHDNLHFDNEYDIHICSKTYEANGHRIWIC